jgi:chorismate synthase
MSFNTFGHLFRVTTFGESHGPAIGCVVDGCPPRIPLTEADIQPYLDKRRPGQSRFTTQRQEPDTVKILSGVFADADTGGQLTTGTPIALLIENVDQRSKDYSAIKDTYRPGHAGYTYDVKYGIQDYRGGGRASARETAMRVAAGAIARKIVPGLSVRGALIQMGDEKIDRAAWDWSEVERNPFFCPDAKAAARFESYLDGVRKNGSSVGAIIEVVADGVPPGLGAPVYGKLDGDLAGAIMGINAVKGVEIGAGFAAAALSGEGNADEMRMGNDGRPRFLSNNAGGILAVFRPGSRWWCALR